MARQTAPLSAALALLALDPLCLDNFPQQRLASTDIDRERLGPEPYHLDLRTTAGVCLSAITTSPTTVITTNRSPERW